MSRLISYIRVSGTQGKNGLDLAAQCGAIARFAAGEGRQVIAEFVEVEIGEADALRGADAGGLLAGRHELPTALGAWFGPR